MAKSRSGMSGLPLRNLQKNSKARVRNLNHLVLIQWYFRQTDPNYLSALQMQGMLILKRIVEMEPSDFQLLQEFTHTDLDTNSFYVKISISPCGQYVASGSRDSNVYIWDTFCPLAPVRCIGHRAESTAVDWSPYGLELASASDDMTCRTWKPDTPLSDHDPSIGHCELLPPQVRTVAIEQAAGKSLQSSSSTLSWNSSKCILPRMDSKNSDSQYSRSWATTADQENYVENIPITVDPPRAVKTKRVRPITDFFNPLPSKRQK